MIPLRFSWTCQRQLRFEMKRLNIYLTEKQKELLNKYNKEGQSISALIRNILDDYFKKIANETSV